MVIADESIGVSQLLGVRPRAAPKVYAYASISCVTIQVKRDKLSSRCRCASIHSFMLRQIDCCNSIRAGLTTFLSSWFQSEQHSNGAAGVHSDQPAKTLSRTDGIMQICSKETAASISCEGAESRF